MTVRPPRPEQGDLTLSFMFPCPPGVMGGGQMLLLNLIPFLVEHGLCRVRLYDHTNGLVRSELDARTRDYQFVSLDGHRLRIPNAGDETFVLFNETFLRYPQFFRRHRGVRVLVWDISTPYWFGFDRFRRFTVPTLRERTFGLLAATASVVFMDRMSLDVVRKGGHFAGFTDESILPVPVYVQPNRYARRPAQGELITVGYIGRSVDWKIHPAAKLVADLGAIDGRFRVVVVTNDAARFRSRLPAPPNVELVFHENLWGERLERYLLEQVDLGYAMGTAALDFARLGIPTVLADYSNHPFPDDYRYRWLSQAEKGVLGNALDDEVGRAHYRRAARRPLPALIGELAADPARLSAACHAHVAEQHDIAAVARRLVAAARQTRLTSAALTAPVFLLPSYLTFLALMRRRLRANGDAWSMDVA